MPRQIIRHFAYWILGDERHLYFVWELILIHIQYKLLLLLSLLLSVRWLCIYARFSNAKFKLTNWFDSWIINGRRHISDECCHFIFFYNFFSFSRTIFIGNVQIQKPSEKKIVHCKFWLGFSFFPFWLCLVLHCLIAFIRHKKFASNIYVYSNILYTLTETRAKHLHKYTHTCIQTQSNQQRLQTYEAA